MSENNENLPAENQSQMLPATARGSDQARAIAEVQAAIIVAKAHPRDEMFCHTQIMKSCERKSLAEKAIYAYRRGSTLVSGPSIALAETIARHWGNINYGFRELSRESGYSEVESFAHDVQTNTRVSRTFTVKHWRDTKQGGYALKEERDIYELVANMAQRRVRACLLEIVPRDIVDDAEQACNKTLVSDDKPLDQQVKDMLVAFDGFGITQENIEEMFQRSIKSIIAADIVKLKQIYTSIKNGVARREDFFDLTPKAADKLNDLVGKSTAKEPVKEEPGIVEKSEELSDQDHKEETHIDDEAAVMTSDHADHPFNKAKFINIRSAGSLKIHVKNHANQWPETTPETKLEFYAKWKRILKNGAVEAWPFEDMDLEPVSEQQEENTNPNEISADVYIKNLGAQGNKETLQEYFKDNNTSILNHSEKDRIIAEYDRLLDANDEEPELKTTNDFLRHIYNATKPSDLSRLQMVHSETIDALPESKEIWSRVDEKLNQLNQSENA